MPDAQTPPPTSPPTPPPPGQGSFFRRKRDEAPVPAPGLSAGKVVGDFRLRSLLGQGGMGQVWEATQESLSRQVAVKFVRPERVTTHQLELFAREARAGGRLSHPGIVAVYGHGESDDLAWIAMELVPDAWDLRDFLDEVGRADEVPAGYDRKVAEFMARVADAVQAAHEAGVIHRDLKPQNILITDEDLPKVTDFGLARIMDESALSVTGDFAGTYFYMSPEQVAAKRAGLDHRTDVFSLGIVLYEMLCLQRPFQGDTEHQVAEQILMKDPPDARSVRSRVPKDLAIIAGKALEKDRDRRYATMSELAADLRRWLGDEPIHARPPTQLDRAVKWCKRNPTKSVASALVSVGLIVISLLFFKLLDKTEEAETSARVAKSNEEHALSEKERADREADAATLRASEVLRLSALQDLEDLQLEAEALWPAHAEHIGDYESWISRARALVADRPEHEARRRDLRLRALPRTEEERVRDRERHPEFGRRQELIDSLVEGMDGLAAARSAAEAQELEASIVAMESELSELNLLLDERRDWRFGEQDTEARWWEKQLTKLISGLDGLESDLLAADAVTESFGWSIAKRDSFARAITERSMTGEEASSRWSEAIGAIASSELYGGLSLSPQLGLFPIGADPISGLWEFAHLQTGEPAQRGADGKLLLSEEMGLVLVLLPGGTFAMGAQSLDPAGRNFDPGARSEESPVHEVELSAFFLSKYEMTQGQWERMLGHNPSQYGPDQYFTSWNRDGKGWSSLHPVEQVSWLDCMSLLGRLGLSLPSEAQWEYGCRGGSSSVYWSGDDAESLQGVANLSDQYGKNNGNEALSFWDSWLDDGHTVHAEIGSYGANVFGLHDVHGNVWEWCLDDWDSAAYGPDCPSNPVVAWEGSAYRVNRGGGFNFIAAGARSAVRDRSTPGNRDNNLGLRPARASRLPTSQLYRR